MHGHGSALSIVEQPVVRVGQYAVGFEPGWFAACQYGREARMLCHDKASSERLVRHPGGSDQTQAVAVKCKQADGVALELGSNGIDGALQAHCSGQFAKQIGK